jgi:hypothetical protein
MCPFAQVLRVDGVEALNLAQLKQQVEGSRAEFVRFELEDHRVVIIARWGSVCVGGRHQPGLVMWCLVMWCKWCHGRGE